MASSKGELNKNAAEIMRDVFQLLSLVIPKRDGSNVIKKWFGGVLISVDESVLRYEITQKSVKVTP